MKKTILFIGAPVQGIPGVKLAQKMGLHVVVSDRNPQAPGVKHADDFIQADTYNAEETVLKAQQYHQQRPIHGVITLAADVPYTVASVAQALGLPGIPLKSAQLAMDKLAMKQQFAADGVRIPWFKAVGSFEALQSAIAEHGYTLIIKPVDSRGSRGVLRLTSDVDLSWAYEYALSFSPTQRVMVEKYLEGPQISTESIVIEGQTYTPGFSDRNYEFIEKYAPHIIENGGELPSHIDPQYQIAVKDMVGQAAASMGITQGVVKGDMVVHQGQAYVIEVAARLSGGFFCTHEIPLNTGVDFVGAAIKLALGEPVNPDSLQPKYQRHVVQRWIFPKPGVVKSIEDVAAAEQLAGVEDVVISAKPGDVFKTPVDSCSTAGMVIVTGESRGQALTRAADAVNMIKVVTS